MLKAFLLPALLGALPLLATAQNTTQDSLLRAGDLVGGRPRTTTPRPATAHRATSAASAKADPYLAQHLHESVDLARVPASQLPDLYANFMEAVRAERRSWTTAEWEEASAALSRMNARYEAVRQELSFNDRLSVRTNQGEFRTLQGARRVKDKLN
ncbi:MAG: hypothetical protein ACRYFX_14395 [Janthinobacterium lividum]